MSSIAQPAQSGILTHYVRYFGGNLMAVAAGFISFPLMTRLLDNHEFGILGYYEAWLLVAAGLLKLGAQHAILRFYPHGGDPAAIQQFRSDQLLLPFALSMAFWLVAAVAVFSLIERVPADERPVIAVMMAMLPLLVWCSLVDSVIYALERSDIALWLRTAWRWSELVVVLITLTWLSRSAAGVLAAKLAVLAVVAIWLAHWLQRWCRARVVRPNLAAASAGLAFGLPMMVNELTTVLFGFADRILLRALTGNFSDVGVYTIGYGLAVAVTALLGQTLGQAFTATAVRVYETRGAAAVVALKKQLLDAWVPVVAITSALLLCVGHDLLIALAGRDKAGSAPVFVVSAITFVWYSMFGIAQYGLLLQRRAMRFLLITLLGTVVNLVLNVPLILKFGVMGAVAATVASHVVLAVVQYWQCPPELRYLPRLSALLLAALYPLPMFALLHGMDYFGLDRAIWRVLAGSVMVMLPVLLLLAISGAARDRVRQFRQLL